MEYSNTSDVSTVLMSTAANLYLLGLAGYALLLLRYSNKHNKLELVEKDVTSICKVVAILGFAPAQLEYGDYCFYGSGVVKDEKEAVRYYKMAADRGKAYAQFKLGVCYEFGTGTTKDQQWAVRYYKLAAEQRHADAQCQLGVCYQFGEGVGEVLSAGC